MSKKSSFLALIIFSIFLLGCSDEETAPSSTCSIIAGADVLSEEVKGQTCNYLEVYLYQGELYITCVCCVCDKLSIPIDCEGNALCELSDSCLTDFHEKADYQFSVEDLE